MTVIKPSSEIGSARATCTVQLEGARARPRSADSRAGRLSREADDGAGGG